TEQAASTRVGRYLVLLEEETDAVGERLHDLRFAFHHRGQVETEPADADAVIGELVACQVEQLAGIEERLARDAADVQAGAAERGPLVDAGDAHAELGRAQRRDISAGAAADYDEVEHHIGPIGPIGLVRFRTESARELRHTP